jgi:hypothetical protein
VEKGSDGMGTADGQYGKPRSQGHQTDLYLHYKKVSLCLYKEHLHVQKQEKTHCLTDLCKEYTVNAMHFSESDFPRKFNTKKNISKSDEK